MTRANLLYRNLRLEILPKASLGTLNALLLPWNQDIIKWYFFNDEYYFGQMCRVIAELGDRLDPVIFSITASVKQGENYRYHTLARQNNAKQIF